MDQQMVLETIAWAEEHFGALQSSTSCSRRDIMRAVKKGLAKSDGYGIQCDAAGFTLDSHVDREGFVLTDAGREKLRGEE